MKKTILIGVAVLFVVIVGVGVYLYMSAGTLVKTAVETYGPQYTKTEVRVGGVGASLLGGEVTISDFFIGNPQGFKTPHAFQVGTVRVVVDSGSLTSDLVRIKEITIDRPDVIYELGGGGSNLQTIQKNVAAAAGTGGKSAAKPAAKESAGPKVIIDHVYVKNAKAAVSMGMLGGKVVPLPIPDLHLTDIGKKENGATFSEAADQVMTAISRSASAAASKIDLGDLKKQAEELSKGVGGAVGDVGKGAGGAVDDVTKGVKGLFGK